MENKIVAESREEFHAWFKAYSDKHKLSKTHTESASFCREVPSLETYRLKMQFAATEAEKDAVYSTALIEATKFCAPIMECAWSSSTGMVRKGLEWFETNKESEIVKVWDANYATLRRGTPDAEALTAYQKAAIAWRKEVGYNLNPQTHVLKQAIAAEYKVPGTIVANIKEMLSDMIRRRNLILSGGSDDAPKRGPVGREHIDWCREFAKGKFLAVLNPPWGEIGKAGKSGYPLLATGLAKLAELEGPDVLNKAKENIVKFQDWLKQNKDQLDEERAKVILDSLVASHKTAVALAKQSNAFRAQGAQIDTVFSSYYWIWKAGVTPITFPSVSQFLFELGRNPKGQKKMHKALTNTPLKWGKKMIELFADNDFKQNRIYMHPCVLTSGRMSELGVTFGAVPVTDPDDAAHGSGHTKAVLNYKTGADSGNPCARIISELFEIQKAGYDIQSMDIVASEHLLHQSLVGKRSPFQNAYLVKGNATNINII
ncbi:nucleocapsid protein [Tofla virus]|uniref:Nucleoprotein n=1 Tax=Tofla virus TaxID=1615758 RepID=A0A0U5AAA8_9VIRU|nr:nucleocapsid protein [Tofla virus]BAU21073.1 nucleocapsid protein [Tofla virus]BAU51653.1 nucleoprotein [Tofla virus]